MTAAPSRKGPWVIVAAFLLLVGQSEIGLARPIDVENDVDISWSRVGPEACTILGLCDNLVVPVIGAPRLVPNASGAGNQLFF
jgi:hypothetical protein